MDYQAALYDPIYTIQGVPAVLTLSGGAIFNTLTALDKTSGVDVGDSGAQVQTIKPVACLRMVELIGFGVEPEALPNATLLMNGAQWDVLSYKLRPSPNGERDGEIWLILSGRKFIESESESAP